MEQIIAAQKPTLSTYRGTINQFLPFVLVRCSKYTNSRRLAETIAVYAFICAYKLSNILDGANKISVLLDIMVGVIGEDLSPAVLHSASLRKTRRGGLHKVPLFKWNDDLRFAMNLAEIKIEHCLDVIGRHKDFVARNIEPEQFDKITESVLEYLVEDALRKLKTKK